MLLKPNDIGKRFKATLLCNCGTGASLGAVWKVNILQFHGIETTFDAFFEFGSKLPLLLYCCYDSLLALHYSLELLIHILYIANGNLVH